MSGLEQMFRPGMADVRRVKDDPRNKMDAEHMDKMGLTDVFSGLRALDNGYRAGPRESDNVQDYRKASAPGVVDELAEAVTELPRNARILAEREGVVDPRKTPTPEQVSGKLPAHWPRR